MDKKVEVIERLQLDITVMTNMDKKLVLTEQILQGRHLNMTNMGKKLVAIDNLMKENL